MAERAEAAEIMEMAEVGPMGEVIASIIVNPDFLMQEHRRKILIEKFSFNLGLSLSVQEAIVGIEIEVGFTWEEIRSHINFNGGFSFHKDAVFAHTSKIIEALREAGKGDFARDLEDISFGGISMFVFSPGTFSYVKESSYGDENR